LAINEDAADDDDDGGQRAGWGWACNIARSTCTSVRGRGVASVSPPAVLGRCWVAGAGAERDDWAAGGVSVCNAMAEPWPPRP
jgi:hypothetical protein